MYFSEFPSQTPEERGTVSLDLMQHYFGNENTHHNLRRALPIVAEAISDDDVLSEYTMQFHPDSRILACLQLQNSRTAVAKNLADSLQEDLPERVAARQLLEYIRGNKDPQLLPPDKLAQASASLPFNLEWPLWLPGKLVNSEPPCDITTWRRLRRAPGSIVAAFTEEGGLQGTDKPESYIMRAAVQLVCGKTTETTHQRVATAISRLPAAMNVLKASGPLHFRGALTISGALSRGNYIQEWQDFHEQASQNLADDPYGHDYFTRLARHDAINLAMCTKNYNAAYGIAEEAYDPENELYSLMLRALCTFVQQSHTAQSQ